MMIYTIWSSKPGIIFSSSHLFYTRSSVWGICTLISQLVTCHKVISGHQVLQWVGGIYYLVIWAWDHLLIESSGLRIISICTLIRWLVTVYIVIQLDAIWTLESKIQNLDHRVLIFPSYHPVICSSQDHQCGAFARSSAAWSPVISLYPVIRSYVK